MTGSPLQDNRGICVQWRVCAIPPIDTVEPSDKQEKEY